jgi:hypothetical protein
LAGFDKDCNRAKWHSYGSGEMKVRYLVAFLPLGLIGCGGVTQGPIAGDATACAAALFAAGVANPAALAIAAATTPACQNLAQEVLQAVIADVSKKQYARGVRN